MSHVPSDECVMSPQINESCAHRWVSHIPTDEWVSIRCHELVLWHIATNLAYQHLTGTFHVTKMNESYPIETYCNTLQHTVTHCNTMYESYSIDGSSHVLNRIGSWRIESWHVATNSCCDTLPRTCVVTRCHELGISASHQQHSCPHRWVSHVPTHKYVMAPCHELGESASLYEPRLARVIFEFWLIPMSWHSVHRLTSPTPAHIPKKNEIF